MKVFITGATGFVGFNVAQAFRRAGYEVWGLTRSEKKAPMLAQNEILPVIGDMQHPESYKQIAADCSVLIHAAADYQNDTMALDKKTVQNLLAIAGKGAQPKTILYTSGCWVHGDTGDKLADETTPVNPIQMVSWRPEIEKMVLNASGAKGVVLRPGCLYGRQGGLTAMWFSGAYNEKSLKAVGDGSNYWAMVHADDLADGYVRAAESGFSGEIFNLTDRSRWTVREMVNSVARAAGYTGKIEFIPTEEAAKEMGPMAEALAVNQHVDSRKAVRLLGWQPRHGGFVDSVDIYFESWRSLQ